jgi:hypothetical protein
MAVHKLIFKLAVENGRGKMKVGEGKGERRTMVMRWRWRAILGEGNRVFYPKLSFAALDLFKPRESWLHDTGA